MDPLTISTAFASIVGLISIFKQERAEQRSQSSEDFTGWLAEHKHDQLREFILSGDELRCEIDTLLRQDHDQITSRLESMDVTLATILSNVEGLGAIGRTIHPQSELSDQATSILRQLVESSASEFCKLAGLQQGVFLQLASSEGQMALGDTRFLEDDLATLVGLGLLTLRIDAHGCEVYGITRRAVKFIAGGTKN